VDRRGALRYRQRMSNGYPPPPPRSRFPWLTMIFVGLALSLTMGTCLSVAGNMGGEKIIGRGSDRVGVIEISGPIAETSKIVGDLYDFAGRSDLVAIVVRVDSPGGAVGPSQEVFDAMRAASAKKPVVASMGSVAASGGFWIAMAGDAIFASPGTITGSIGVISQMPDLRELMRLAKIDVRTFKSGVHKDLGNPLREMTPDDEKIVMSMIDDIYAQFVAVIAERRNLAPEQVRAFADGRIFTGQAAQKYGVVDELGGLYPAAEKAVRLARERSPEPTDRPVEPALVYPKKPTPSFLELLSSAGESFFRGMAAGARQEAASRVEVQ